MVITHTLRMDLEGKEPVQWIEAAQGDAYTRCIKMLLFSQHAKWTVPEGVTVLIRYRKSDGKSGEYDTLPDGSAAWSVSGNELNITLVPQVLTATGSVMLYASLILEERVLNTFAVEISVRSPVRDRKGKPLATGIPESSENYFYVTGILPVPDMAAVGQYLRVLEVDSLGRVTRVEAVDRSPDGKDGYTPVRGVDYWTETDKAEIKAYVDDAILGGAW